MPRIELNNFDYVIVCSKPGQQGIILTKDNPDMPNWLKDVLNLSEHGLPNPSDIMNMGGAVLLVGRQDIPHWLQKIAEFEQAGNVRKYFGNREMTVLEIVK